jgi:uncharacterized protein
MPLLSVTANDVDAAGLGLDAELPPAWIDGELSDADVKARAPGRVSVRLSRTGGDEIVVRGRVKAALVTPCARCTEPATLDVDTELTLLLRPAKEDKPGKHHKAVTMGETPKPPARPVEEYEFSSDEADVDTYDGETVILDSFVREALLLEVPNFPLCSEGCPGIQPPAEPAPAGEPHLDPRLSPLAALKAKMAAGEAPPAKPKKKKKE